MDRRCGVWAVQHGPSPCWRVWVLVFPMYFLFYSFEGKRQESVDISSWCHQANKLGTLLVQSRARNRARPVLGGHFLATRACDCAVCLVCARVHGEGAQGCGEAHLRLTKGRGARPGLAVPRSELTPDNGGAAQEFMGVMLVLHNW